MLQIINKQDRYQYLQHPVPKRIHRVRNRSMKSQNSLQNSHTPFVLNIKLLFIHLASQIPNLLFLVNFNEEMKYLLQACYIFM